MLPGLGTVHDLKKAHSVGASVARIATHCTEADVSIQHFGAARELGMETVGFLMLSHKASPEELAKQARIMVDAGAQCVYVVDSAGALVLDSAQERIQAVIDEIGRPTRRRSASTATRTSAWASRTRCWPTRPVPSRSTARCAPSAPEAGNSPTEVLAATFERMGIRTGVDLGEVLSAAEDVVRPFIPRLPWMDRASITQGYAGVYSSFLLHAERAAERYEVPAHAILQRVGEAGYVGGQEDMIIDIALQLAEEARAGRSATSPGWGALMTPTTGHGRPEGGWDIESVAAELLACEDERREREPFTDEWPELDLDTGYADPGPQPAEAARPRREAHRRQARPDQPRPSSSGWACTSPSSPGSPTHDPAGRRPRAPVAADPPAHRARDRLRHGRPARGPGVTCARRPCRPSSRCGVAPRSSTAATATSGSPPVTSPPTTPPPAPSSPARSACRRPTSTSALEAVARRGRRRHRRLRDRRRRPGPPRRGPRPRRQRPRPPRPRHRGRLDRAHRRHDGRRVLTSRLERRAALHQPRLGLPQRREGLTLPLIEITLVEGRTPEQLRSLISTVTRAAVESVDAPLESVRVVLREVPATHFAAGDVTIDERRAQRHTAQPFLKLNATPEVTSMTDYPFFGHIIDGEEVESLDGKRFDTINPWTREKWAEVAEASAADADRAIASARKAFDEGPWPRMGRAERANLIHQLADLMEERADELARLDSTDMGKPFARPSTTSPARCGTSASSPTTSATTSARSTRWTAGTTPTASTGRPASSRRSARGTSR